MLRRRFYEGRSQTEIAEATGMPLGTVEDRAWSAGCARLRDGARRTEEAGRVSSTPSGHPLERASRPSAKLRAALDGAPSLRGWVELPARDAEGRRRRRGAP